MEFEAPSGTTLYLSAQKTNEEGTISAKIYVDGKLLQEAESDSPYGIASVDGIVPSGPFVPAGPSEELSVVSYRVKQTGQTMIASK
jgi:hypothetical protein